MYKNSCMQTFYRLTREISISRFFNVSLNVPFMFFQDIFDKVIMFGYCTICKLIKRSVQRNNNIISLLVGLSKY